MRICEIDVNVNKQLVDNIKSKYTSEAYILYNSIKDYTNNFNTHVNRLCNPITVIDIIDHITELMEKLSGNFPDNSQVMILLNELIDYFNQ
jgi:hypothetical protein